jgi:RNA polymerase sigma factor (sigma-70 family)
MGAFEEVAETPEDSDARLLAWSIAGDGSAFRQLYDRHAAAVHAYLSRRVGRHESDDLLSEVWFRAYRARHGYDGRSANARPWLYGIARNVMLEHWRRRLTAGTVPAALGGLDPWPDVDARLDAQIALAHLRETLSRLSEDEREVLLLVVWEQLSPSEAAIALGIPPGTARSRLHRARTALREALLVPVDPSFCSATRRSDP